MSYYLYEIEQHFWLLAEKNNYCSGDIEGKHPSVLLILYLYVLFSVFLSLPGDRG